MAECYVCLQKVDNYTNCHVCNAKCCRRCILEIRYLNERVEDRVRCGVCRQYVTPPVRDVVNGCASFSEYSPSMLECVLVSQLGQYAMVYTWMHKKLCALERKRTLLRSTASDISQRLESFNTDTGVFVRLLESYGVAVDAAEICVRAGEISNFFYRGGFFAQRVLRPTISRDLFWPNV